MMEKSSETYDSYGGEKMTIFCSDGIELAALRWKPPRVPSTDQREIPRHRIICLHGWMDNAATFHILAPELANMENSDFIEEIVAFDFPGHGLSSHKSADNVQVLSDYAYYVMEALSWLGWYKPGEKNDSKQITVIGHSMGAGVATFVAAAWPDRIRSLVLLESFGPVFRNVSDVSKHLRASCEKRIRSNRTLYADGLNKGSTRSRIYPSIDIAVKTRMYTAKMCPGEQYISKEAAEALVGRGTLKVKNEGVRFRHDPRLSWPSIQYNTQNQVEHLW
eukprot:CAMPEP_0194269534 /NCGR_PEP_ID=MMETSP0169-20130528/3670_1 /TAXON_ID=218684 /ORGANISM="Corethron pennatum, Strain L29A3" /LENGTH=276 /DNA_ID=CAMNT_0039011213 /DNA_START=237 /DNA_END=1064 /DNA_ORIENTATION=-